MIDVNGPGALGAEEIAGATDWSAWFSPRKRALESDFSQRFGESWPAAFADRLRYPLETPGKRIRPALCMASYEAVSGDAALGRVLPVAVALEMVHTYSLVHDDLPAMDNAELRRGRQTVHRRWDDATAILVGDALLTEAFSVLCEVTTLPETRVHLVRLLARASGYAGMVGGQAADIGIGGSVNALNDLTRLHLGKTGALIEASVVMGAALAGACSAQSEALQRYGAAVGLAFQLADDLLDAEEDLKESPTGPLGPPSFVRLLGADETRRRALELADEAVDAARTAVGERSVVLEAIARFTVERAH